MVRDCVYNEGVDLQYLLIISVSSVGQKLNWNISGVHLSTSFSLRIVVAYTCTTNKWSHSHALIHFQGCKCMSACKYSRYNFICQAGIRRLRCLTFGDPTCCFNWPGKLRRRTLIAPVKRDQHGPRRFLKYGGKVSISRCRKIKNVDNWWLIQLFCV